MNENQKKLIDNIVESFDKLNNSELPLVPMILKFKADMEIREKCHKRNQEEWDAVHKVAEEVCAETMRRVAPIVDQYGLSVVSNGLRSFLITYQRKRSAGLCLARTIVIDLVPLSDPILCEDGIMRNVPNGIIAYECAGAVKMSLRELMETKAFENDFLEVLKTAYADK